MAPPQTAYQKSRIGKPLNYEHGIEHMRDSQVWGRDKLL